MSDETKETREQWLEDSIALLDEHVFQPAGYAVPENVKASCGFPSAQALSRRKRLGECWKREASEGDTTIHIFISPLLSEPREILAVLTHELVHSIKPDAKHGPAFRFVMDAVDLQGPPGATHAGSELNGILGSIVEMLGDYPHARIIPLNAPVKPQTARLLKAECLNCGYTIRVTKKWADKGLPVCPCGVTFKLVEKEN